MKINKLTQLLNQAEEALREADKYSQEFSEELGERMLAAQRDLKRKKAALLRTLMKKCAGEVVLIRGEELHPIIDIREDGEALVLRPHSWPVPSKWEWLSPEEAIVEFENTGDRFKQISFTSLILSLSERAKAKAKKMAEDSASLRKMERGLRESKLL